MKSIIRNLILAISLALGLTAYAETTKKDTVTSLPAPSLGATDNFGTLKTPKLLLTEEVALPTGQLANIAIVSEKTGIEESVKMLNTTVPDHTYTRIPEETEKTFLESNQQKIKSWKDTSGTMSQGLVFIGVMRDPVKLGQTEKVASMTPATANTTKSPNGG